MKIYYASICSEHPYFSCNKVFNMDLLDDEYSILEPYITLKKYLLEKYNCILNTIDININNNNKELFRLYLDPKNDDINIAINNYAFLAESSLTKPQNKNKKNWNNFHKVFCWDLSLVDQKKFIFQPIPFFFKKIDNTVLREIKLSAIAANKNLPISGNRNLYQKRLEIFRYLNNKPDVDFQLYGRGWDSIIQTNNIFNYYSTKLINQIKLAKFVTPIFNLIHGDLKNIYKGQIENKYEILHNSVFNIAFENSFGDNGYVTEKIFQAIVCGSVPIYLGAADINNYIPEYCYINYSQFESIESLINYLNSLSDRQIEQYKENGAMFIRSKKVEIFKSKYFCENITSHIIELKK